MKTYFSNKISKRVLGSVAIGFFAFAALVFAQTQFTEVNDLSFRSSNPQLRFAGTATVRNLAGTGAGQMAFARPVTITAAATLALAATNCNGVVVATLGSGTQTFTLPAVANTGCTVTFIAGSAAGEILVNAASTVTCTVSTFAVVGADADTGVLSDATCATGLKNTAATNAVGDSMTLVSDGTQWLGVGPTAGTWAAQ